jgi:glycosyltransferase involved in cell wall biosynthesis
MSPPLPTVDVIIPTNRRPALLRAALDSVLAQNYAGPLSVTVVFDREDPDRDLVASGPIVVRVLANEQTPGLAGARNTGILATDGELVAFLDDDDRWHPDKLTRQVGRLAGESGAWFATTAVDVDYEGTTSSRRAGTSSVRHVDLLASRMSMLHSSTFLIRRDALLGPLGLVDETAPSSQNEDWDLLLRASALRPLAHVDDSLVSVRWGSTSRFAAAWQSRIEGAEWILGRHSDIRSSRVGYARLLAQMAFGRAALGERRAALALARRAARVRWHEPRIYLALAVASGCVSAESVQQRLHKHGHGV